MSVLNINKEKAIKKLQEESGYTIETACSTINRLDKVCEELHPYIESWDKGDCADYTFKDVSLLWLMRKYDCSYLGAILWMDLILKNPDRIEHYKNMSLKQR